MMRRVFPDVCGNNNNRENEQNSLERQTIDSKNISMISSRQIDNQKYNFGLNALKFYRSEFQSSIPDTNKKSVCIKHEHFKPCRMVTASEDVNSNNNSKNKSFSKQHLVQHDEFGHMKRQSYINEYGKSKAVLRQKRKKRTAPVPPSRIRSEFNSNLQTCNNLKDIMISES